MLFLTQSEDESEPKIRTSLWTDMVKVWVM